MAIEREPLQARRAASLWREVGHQFIRHKGAVVASVLLGLIVLACTVGPVVYPHDPFAIDTANANRSPTWTHPMGTDNLGRDTMARVLIGGRVSLSIGLTAMTIGLVLGTAVGVAAGYFRRLDGPLMRLTDLFLSLPVLPVLLVAIMVLAPPMRGVFGPDLGTFLLVVAIIGATSWMQPARVLRGQVLSVKNAEFVTAARGIGVRPRNVIFGHILPNVMSPVIVAGALGVAGAIITESAISFLGLGFSSNLPTWGRLLHDARDYIQLTPMRVIWPGVMISLTVICVNFIGDGLRDAMDPRGRRRR